MASRQQILSLYKSLMKQSQKFANYNYRCYALRRVRDAFKENKALSDQKAIKKEFEYGTWNLSIVRRQGNDEMRCVGEHKMFKIVESGPPPLAPAPHHRCPAQVHESDYCYW